MNKNLNNLTGRVFMCTGIDEDDMYNVSDAFKAGNLYLEVKKDIDECNMVSSEEYLIADDNGLPLYVLKKDFVLMMEFSAFLTKTIQHKPEANEE